MGTSIRQYREADEPAVVRLSLRAWTPVHDSMRDVMGDEIFGRMYRDGWRRQQQEDVEKALRDEQHEVWVAEVDGEVAGFATAVVDAKTRLGEIFLVAVDPDFQGRGLGTRLTDVATDWLRDAGMAVVVVSTGGDVGHAPARRTYEKAGRRCPPSTTSRPCERARSTAGGPSMPAATLTVGNVEITAILDVDTSMPLAEMFDGSSDPPPGGTASLAVRHPDEFTADAWRFRDHCFLVRTPTRVTLVDTGAGPADSALGRWLGVAGTLPDELAGLGVMPDDVDDVILTHVHSDHTGWSTTPSPSGWVPRFPNARYHLHGADVAWMRGLVDEEDVREFAEVIAPLESAGQLDTSPEDREVSPGLSLRHAPGHTPGHRCVLLDAGGERVLFAGDLLHFTFQLNDPGFRAPGDVDPDEGSRTRTAWLDRAESDGFTLATAHLPPFPIVRIVREGGERLLRRR